jgi:hypothetical protein
MRGGLVVLPVGVRQLACLAAAACFARVEGSETTVSFSTLDFKTCADDARGQRWKVQNIGGTGKIIDVDSGRCLTAKICSAPWPGGATTCKNACSMKDGDDDGTEVVVLEDCDLKDTCGGATAQWKSTQVAGGYHFTSQGGSKNKCLNAVGDPTYSRMYKLVVCTCGVESNFLWKFDTKSRHITTTAPYSTAPCPDKSNCCLAADPCTLPCSWSPGGWGWTFVLILFLSMLLYVGGGAVSIAAAPTSL